MKYKMKYKSLQIFDLNSSLRVRTSAGSARKPDNHQLIDQQPNSHL